jgi:hypothetical protein
MSTTKLSSRQTVPAATAPIRTFSKAKVVAQRLGVCRRTIFRWANSGMLTRHKINERVVLFDEAEVLALIEGARVVSR